MVKALIQIQKVHSKEEEKMFSKIKMFFIRLVAKKVIDVTTGKEKFEKSKTKIGVVIAAIAFIIDVVLPEFGVYWPVSDKILKLAEVLGISLTGYGLRDAQEKAALAAATKKA